MHKPYYVPTCMCANVPYVPTCPSYVPFLRAHFYVLFFTLTWHFSDITLCRGMIASKLCVGYIARYNMVGSIRSVCV